MKRQVVQRLFAVAGLSLLLAIGVMVSLGASTQAQVGGPVELDVVPIPPQVEAGQYVTLTAKVRDAGVLSVTEMYLEIGLPPANALILDDPTGQPGRSISAEDLAGLDADESLLHTIRLRALADVSGTFPFSATLWYTFTVAGGEVEVGAISVPGEIVVVGSEPASQSPLPTPTPTEESVVPTPSPTPLPTATSSPSPPPSATPTSTPASEVEPTPASTPSSIIDQAIKFVTDEPLLSAVICLAPLAVLLIAVILLMLARRKRTAPPTPASSMPPSPPPPAGPYLEGVDAAGTAHRFPLSDEFGVGRATENDLVITENFPGWETVSRHHARIYQQGAFWIVEDLQSSNGVYVNGQRTGLNRLRDSAQLGIGGVGFVFHAGKEASDELS